MVVAHCEEYTAGSFPPVMLPALVAGDFFPAWHDPPIHIKF
jgi:hypothetical protein